MWRFNQETLIDKNSEHPINKDIRKLLNHDEESKVKKKRFSLHHIQTRNQSDLTTQPGLGDVQDSFYLTHLNQNSKPHLVLHQSAS